MAPKRKVEFAAIAEAPKSIKKEKKYDTNPVLNVFADLYKRTVNTSTLPTKEKQQEVEEALSLKHLPTDNFWYPIYADQPDSYQADLICSNHGRTEKGNISYKPYVCHKYKHQVHIRWTC